MVVAFDIDVIVWNLSIYWWLLVLKCVSLFNYVFETVTMQTIYCLRRTRSLLNLQILVLQEKKLWLKWWLQKQELTVGWHQRYVIFLEHDVIVSPTIKNMCTSKSNKAGTFWCLFFWFMMSLLTKNDNLLHWYDIRWMGDSISHQVKL